MLDHVESDLDVLQRTTQQPGDLFGLALLHKFQMIEDDLVGQPPLAPRLSS
jgi:hypothetical protein